MATDTNRHGDLRRVVAALPIEEGAHSELKEVDHLRSSIRAAVLDTPHCRL